MGRNTRRNYKVHQEVYNILKDAPEGMTAQQINDVLNSRVIVQQQYTHTKVRVTAAGNSTIQLSSILRGGVLFESFDSCSTRDSVGRITPVKVYRTVPLEYAYQKMLDSRKDVKKFPKVLREYAAKKEMKQ